jgi:hypothetical protein
MSSDQNITSSPMTTGDDNTVIQSGRDTIIQRASPAAPRFPAFNVPASPAGFVEQEAELEQLMARVCDPAASTLSPTPSPTWRGTSKRAPAPRWPGGRMLYYTQNTKESSPPLVRWTVRKNQLSR